MNPQILELKEKVYLQIDTAHNNINKLLEEGGKEINVFFLNEEDIKEIHKLQNCLESLKILNEGIYKKATTQIIDKGKMQSLDDSFTRKKVVKLIIDGKDPIAVKSAKDALLKFVNLLIEEDKEKFLKIANSMDKIFSYNKDELYDPKLLSNCNIYIATKSNSNNLFKILKRLAIEYGIDPSTITVEVE